MSPWGYPARRQTAINSGVDVLPVDADRDVGTTATGKRPLDTARPTLAPAHQPPPAIDVQATADAYNAAQAARRAALQAPVATEAPPTQNSTPTPRNGAGAVEGGQAADAGQVLIPIAPDEATATPLPQPGAPGFVTSFKPAGCAIGITYLDTHDPCYRVPPGAVLPQPGDSSFKESFH